MWTPLNRVASLQRTESVVWSAAEAHLLPHTNVQCTLSGNDIFKWLLNWCFWCVRSVDPFIETAPNFTIPGYWSTLAVKKFGSFQRQRADANAFWHCWQWKKSVSSVGLMSRPGRKKKVKRMSLLTGFTSASCECTESLFITTGRNDLPLSHIPPRSQLKFVAEMSTSCISVKWSEKRRHVLFYCLVCGPHSYALFCRLSWMGSGSLNILRLTVETGVKIL